jgi:transposase
MTYSIDFRKKVMDVRVREDLTIAAVAERFCIGAATVVRWLKRLEPQRTRYKPATKIDRIALARDVREWPDASQRERAKRLGVSAKGIDHALRRMNITYKKNTAASKSRQRRSARLPTAD